MSLLDALLYGYKTVQEAGVDVVERDALNFIGATVADVGGVTTVTVSADALSTGTLAIANGGTGITTYAKGDTLYASAANVLSKLAIGTAGQVWTVSAGGVPEWADAAGGGDSCTLYVDKGGSDATGTRGDAGKPYLTITGALADAQSGDVVRVGPGTWAEEILLPELAAISLVGSGIDSTKLEFSPVSHDAVITAVPTATELARCLIADMTVRNTGGGVGYAINLDGSSLAAPGIFVSSTDGLTLSNVRTRTDLNKGVRVRCAGYARANGCHLDILALRAVSEAYVSGLVSSDGVTIAWDPADTLPTGLTSSLTTIVGSECSSVSVDKLATVIAAGCGLGTLAATLTTDTGVSGYLTAHACSIGAATVSGDSATAGANLDGSTMSSLTVTRSAGAARIAVSARGGSIAGAVSAGNGCDIDIRGSHFVQSSLAHVGDGAIDRTTHREAVNLSAGSTTINFTVPFVTSGYTVAYQLSGEASTPGTAFLADDRLGFVATCTAGDADAAIMIIHS